MVGIMGHGIGGADESGDVAAGFGGEVIIDLPIVFGIVGRGAGAGQRLIYIAGAAVIGSDGEAPVIEDFIELLEIFCGHGG